MLAHELSHVAHRDVMVMSLAATAGIITGMVLRGAQFGGLGMLGGGRRDDRSGVPVWLLILLASVVVYAISFIATKMLSRYRELAADRAGAFLTGNPSALASALTKITGEIAVIPQKDLRAAESMNAFFIAPAVAGVSWKTLTSTHPSLEQRLAQLAQVATELGRPLDGGFPQGRARRTDARPPDRPDLRGSMGIWDTIRGRRTVRGPQFDGLFALPSAAVTLQSAASFVPTGRGRSASAAPRGPPSPRPWTSWCTCSTPTTTRPVELVTDSFGFTWLVSRQDDVESLVTDLHTVAGSLEVQGFAAQILCSLVPFRDATGRTVALVYLHKSGTFYPFAPIEGQQRDNVLELQVRDLLRGEMPLEADLSRWMALWGAPGL